MRLRKEGDLVDGDADKRLDFVCADKENVGANKNWRLRLGTRL